MAKNPWLSAYLSAANQVTTAVYNQQAAIVRKESARARRDIIKAQGEMQREFMQSWMDVWMPTTSRRTSATSRTPSSTRGRKR